MTEPRSLKFDWNALPTLTPQLEGTGGTIRTVLEDFRVDEIPLYPFSGEGEFLFVRLEKQGHNTNHLMGELCNQLGIEPKKVGVAGLKDRHAITTQWMSLPAKLEKHLGNFQLEGVRILETARHDNKLGMGHLQGNRFEIRVRGAARPSDRSEGHFRQDASETLERAQAVLDLLLERGLPNYFGPQRFGVDGRNAEEGLKLIKNKMRGGGSIPLKRFLVSAVQSQIFNAFVAARLERDIFDRLLEGDMAKKHDTGGVFKVLDAELETPRAQRGEVSALGTLFGRKAKPLGGEAGSLEREILASFSLEPEDFSSRLGDRRLTRVFITHASLEGTEDGYWLRFDLPRGSFATSVLRELTKTAVDSADESSSEEENTLESSSEA